MATGDRAGGQDHLAIAQDGLATMPVTHPAGIDGQTGADPRQGASGGILRLPGGRGTNRAGQVI
jgi:hypothetical protein